MTERDRRRFPARRCKRSVLMECKNPRLVNRAPAFRKYGKATTAVAAAGEGKGEKERFLIFNSASVPLVMMFVLSEREYRFYLLKPGRCVLMKNFDRLKKGITLSCLKEA